jgi:methionyl-tRNA formyltransferase
MRVVFMGTPAFALPTLAGIREAGHEVAAVYTQPPRPAGRGMARSKSPVHRCAERHGLPVFTPATLRSDAETRAFADHHPEVAVVVAYGLILPLKVLQAPRSGCLNLHASALPRWRGAAPIQRAILAGDTETAATIMRMDAGLDTGPICLMEQVPIGADATAGELHDLLAQRGAKLMVEALGELARGHLQCTPQPDEGVTYAAKLGKDETRLDFRQPAREVHNRVRGLSPTPGAWFEATHEGRTERIKLLRTALLEAAPSAPPGTILDDALTVACGAGALRMLEVQRSGRKPMAAGEFLRGFPLGAGARLSPPRQDTSDEASQARPGG